MLLKLIKLPLRLAALPILLALFVLQLRGAILIGLSSVVNSAGCPSEHPSGLSTQFRFI